MNKDHSINFTKVYFRPNWEFQEFDPDKVFEEHGLKRSDNILNSRVILTSSLKRARLLSVLFPTRKVFLVHADPRGNRTQSKTCKGIFGSTVHLINVFTGEFFRDNYSYCNRHGIGGEPLPEEVDDTNFDDRVKRVGVFMAYSDQMAIETGPPFGNNLHAYRRDLARRLHQSKMAEIRGFGWPPHYNSECDDFLTVGNEWASSKISSLRQYWFSLAIENTLAPYYVTEKIWQAIIAGSIPIYYGGHSSTIYEDFPAESFIDASIYKANELIEHLKSITKIEAVNRLKKCRKAYNRMLERKPPNHDKYIRDCLNRISLRIRSVL